VQYLAHDAEARKQLLAAVGAELTALATGSAGLIGARMAEIATLEDAKDVAREIASLLEGPLSAMGNIYAMITEANLAVLDDRKAAAREVAETVGLVAKALLGTVKVPGDASGQLIDPLTKSLESRLVASAVGDAADLKAEIDETLTAVTALALYNQEDGSGYYALRARMAELGMKPPPWGEPRGDLALPHPFESEARTQLMGWLKRGNPLYAMAHAFVVAPGGLVDTFNGTVVATLYERDAES
jgi:hypothetical protein